MSEELNQERPILGAGVWFAVSVIVVATLAYNALPYFYSPPPRIDVTISEDMVRKVIGEALPKYTQEWSIAGAKAYAVLLTKLPPEKIKISMVVELASQIRPNMILDEKKTKAKQKKTNEDTEQATVKVTEAPDGKSE